MVSHDCKIRVWYKHTDQMAICHHSNYICYYEAARSELLRDLGMSFAEVERRGLRGTLPRALEDFCALREAYPDLSLRDLGEVSDPPLSKSALYHRVLRLEKLLE